MKIQLDSELETLFSKIISQNKTQYEWALIESSDMFQSERYCGGFDATENAFCFSFYDDSGSEYWFQVTLDEITKLMASEYGEIDVRPAEL